MRPLGAFLLILALAPTAPAGPSLKEARERWLRGSYDEARELYQELAKDTKTRDAAVIGMSRCFQSQGQYDKALATIDEALKAGPTNADLQARRAELLYLRGRWDDAEKAAEAAV